MANNRIPAGAYAAELMFGARVPKCRGCGAIDLMAFLPTRAAHECRCCGRLEAPEHLLLVPQDPRAREQLGL